MQVKLTITRKRMLRAALIPYRVYVNGQYVGTLKNGKTLEADIPKQTDYIFDMGTPFLRSSVLRDCDGDHLSLHMEIIGGGESPREPVLLTNKFDALHPLEDADFSWGALTRESELELLDDPRRILALCMLFWNTLGEGASELLYLPQLPEMLEALRTVGACDYADAVERILRDLFPDTPLPLDREQTPTKEFLQKLRTADSELWNAEGRDPRQGIIAQFHRTVTEHILKNQLF